MPRKDSSFNALSFLWRWALALTVVIGTYNPTTYSFVHWVRDEEGRPAVKFLVGVIFLILYIVFLRATWASVGVVGLILMTALAGALIWVGIDLGVLTLESPTAVTWVALVVAATILAVGMSFSHVWRRLTGQVDVDEIEE